MSLSQLAGRPKSCMVRSYCIDAPLPPEQAPLPYRERKATRHGAANQNSVAKARDISKTGSGYTPTLYYALRC